MRRALLGAAAALVAVSGVVAPAARAGAPRLALAAHVDQLTAVAAVPGDPSRLLIAERRGRVALLHAGRRSTFLDLRAKVKADGYEQGLLGLALAPDYATSGQVAVYYTTPAPGGGEGSDLVVSVLRRRDAAHADPASERVLLRIPHRLEQYENGGGLVYGPDGLLWIGTGDGGGENDLHHNAQRLDPATDDPATGADALLGKLLRIDPRPGDGCGGACTIPAGNPGFAQREVWAYGLRNPWRFTFDRAGGDLVIADVGQARSEEVDLGRAPNRARGANFGWPLYEGSSVVPGAAPPAGCCTAPVLERAHGGPESFDAIIGGVVVRDPGLPALTGRYLYGPTTTGHVHAVDLRIAPPGDRDTGLVAEGLTSFGEDACARVYVTTFGGFLYHLTQDRDDGCSATPPEAPVAVAVAPLQRLITAKGRPLAVAVTCAKGCRASARGTLHGAGAGLATGGASATVRAGQTRTLRLTVPARVRRALGRALRRSATVTVTVAVTARGRTARVSARVVG